MDAEIQFALKNAALHQSVVFLDNEFPEASQTIPLSDPYLICSRDCPICMDQATLNYLPLPFSDHKTVDP